MSASEWMGAPARELQTACPLAMSLVLEACIPVDGFQVVHLEGLWAFGPVPEADQRPLSGMLASGDLTKCGNWFIYPSTCVPSRLTATAPAAVPEPVSAAEWFREGEHVIAIQGCYLLVGRNKAPYFIINARIVDSDLYPAGETRTIAINLREEFGLGAIKSFVMSASEVTADKVTPPMCQLVSTFNVFAGVRLRLRCVPVKTRTGVDFTKHVWSSASEAAMPLPRRPYTAPAVAVAPATQQPRLSNSAQRFAAIEYDDE